MGSHSPHSSFLYLLASPGLTTVQVKRGIEPHQAVNKQSRTSENEHSFAGRPFDQSWDVLGA